MQTTIIHHINGKLIRIGWQDYHKGDQAVMVVSVLQDGAWCSICDYNINSRV